MPVFQTYLIKSFSGCSTIPITIGRAKVPR